MDGFIRVTNEDLKKGPLKGLVLVGRGPKAGGGPQTVGEQVLAKVHFAKLVRVDPGQIPDDWLQALGYDWPRPALKPVEVMWVNFLPGLIEPKPVPTAKWRLEPIALGLALYVAAVALFWWIKTHG